jgi:hypothetical protein
MDGKLAKTTYDSEEEKCLISQSCATWFKYYFVCCFMARLVITILISLPTYYSGASRKKK